MLDKKVSIVVCVIVVVMFVVDAVVVVVVVVDGNCLTQMPIRLKK